MSLETVENPKSPITKRELIGCKTFQNDEKSRKPVEKSRCFFDVIHQNEGENKKKKNPKLWRNPIFRDLLKREKNERKNNFFVSLNTRKNEISTTEEVHGFHTKKFLK